MKTFNDFINEMPLEESSKSSLELAKKAGRIATLGLTGYTAGSSGERYTRDKARAAQRELKTLKRLQGGKLGKGQKKALKDAEKFQKKGDKDATKDKFLSQIRKAGILGSAGTLGTMAALKGVEAYAKKLGKK